jgi:hypothetical protein
VRCAICGQDLQPADASVATTDGAVVHVACADREAAVAWTRCRRWALLHGLLVVVGIAALPWSGMPLWLLALISTGTIAHPLLHRRVWYFLVRDIRRWLGQRGQR